MQKQKTQEHDVGETAREARRHKKGLMIAETRNGMLSQNKIKGKEGISPAHQGARVASYGRKVQLI
jgi:hypothetical protein